jgi:hypothetical protein
MKTHAICRIPLVGCLQEASKYVNIPFDWQPINEKQESFKKHLNLEEETSLLSKEEFESTASSDAETINKWLEEKGFTLKCPKLNKNEFATASVMKIFVEWMNEAKKRKIEAKNSETYDYACFEDNLGKKISVGGQTWDMTQISTKDVDTNVFIAMNPNFENTDDEENLLNVLKTLQKHYESKNTTYEYKGVNVPMIDLNLEVEQDWICGLNNQGYIVSKCSQQFILKFNEKGAVAKSAAVMSFKRSITIEKDPPLTFDAPFIIWFSRSGVTYPLFVATCGYDCWKEPANLD